MSRQLPASGACVEELTPWYPSENAQAGQLMLWSALGHERLAGSPPGLRAAARLTGWKLAHPLAVAEAGESAGGVGEASKGFSQSRR